MDGPVTGLTLQDHLISNGTVHVHQTWARWVQLHHVTGVIDKEEKEGKLYMLVY